VARRDMPRWPWVPLGFLAFLCLTWTGIGVEAAGAASQQAATSASTTLVPMPMPMASDRMPCALCYAAPGPVPYGGGGSSAAQEATVRWVPQARPSTELVGPRAHKRCQGRVPIRIAYCRWLD
jgi:hypothetical protein